MSRPRVLAGLVAAFALLVALELHGLSLGVWHAVIDGSDADEVLLGTPRRVRADDWRVVLPLAYAQAEQEPRFPLVNRDIGLGQAMTLPLQLPVGGALALFRPTLWGFFLGKDTGTAWLWWSGVLGLFAVWMLLFEISAGAGRTLAALGAAAVVFSPFFQFWSFNFASVAIYAGLAGIGALGLLAGTRARAILPGGALLGFAGGCFALVSYPPFMVPLFWLVLAVTVAALLRDGLPRHALGARAAGALVAAVIPLAAALLLWSEAGDAIRVLRETAYPGARVSTGGDLPAWRLFAHNLAFAWQVDAWGPLRNISSASAFPLFFPVVALGVATSRKARRDPLCLLLLVYCVAISAFGMLGAPAWLARVTGFSFVEARRGIIGLGLADILLLVRWLSLGARAAPAVALAGGALFALLLAAFAFSLVATLPDVSLAFSLAVAAGNGAFAWIVLRGTRPRLALALLAAAGFLATAWFNPLARGGADFLAENELSRRILEIDRESNGRSLWLALGSPSVSNLFRAIGVHSLTGVQPVPQLELWKHFDPGGERAEVYNRYANVIAQPSPDGATRIGLQARDAVVLEISPGARALDDLGVTHLVVTDPGRPPFEGRPRLRHLGSVGTHHLYARERRP